MGSRQSKANRKTSYDVNQVTTEGNKDIEYQNFKSDQPKVEPQPTVVQNVVEKKELDPKLRPEWLNENSFVNVLKDCVDDFVGIKEFKAFPGLNPGENYASLMVNVKVNVELKDNSTRDISLMLKLPHNDEMNKMMLKEANIFALENAVYFEILPLLEALYKEQGLNVSFGPTAYKVHETSTDFSVLLEDLRPLGYQNTNRLKSLDEEHTEAVLRKLAQFHAASACYFATKGPFGPKFMKGIYGEDSKMKDAFGPAMDGFKTSFLENMKHYKDCEKYSDDVDKCIGRLGDTFGAMVMKYDENDFNVMNHGDAWSNNILFKYRKDNGRIADVLFVDFQLTKFGSPVRDLLYFLFSSTQIHIKLENFDRYIRYYYDHLIENLKLLKYPKECPKLRDFYMQIYKYGTWALLASVMVLPIVILDPTDSASFANFIATDDVAKNFKNMLYANQRYCRQIEQILPWLYYRGLLESYDSCKQVITPKKETEPVPIKITPSDLVVPEWINPDNFNGIAKENVDNFNRISSFNVKSATKPGDNYSATLLEIDIEVETTDKQIHSKSYMVKVEPSGEQARAMLNMTGAFAKEIAIYSEYASKLSNVFKDHQGADLTLCPKCYELPNKPQDIKILVLENLRLSGYRNEDRLKGLDLNHTKAVLKKLAEFHALSACFAVAEKFPQLFYSSMYCEELRPIMTAMGQSFFPVFMDCVKSFENKELYEDNVKEALTNCFNAMVISNKVDENKFNVLNHGDCWTNNILFQHDADGNIKDTCFIDFQLIKYGTPAQDLYYFLMTSPCFEIKLEKFDYFVAYYHEELLRNLLLFKYPKNIPTLKELHLELLEHGCHGLAAVYGVLSAILLEPTEKADLETLLDGGNDADRLRRQLYANPRYQKHADAILVWLNHRGLLDLSSSTVVNSNPAAEPPNWLKKDLLNEIITDESNLKAIKSFTGDLATKGGDNYASQVFRIRCEAETSGGETETINFILKCCLQYEGSKAMADLWHMFEKENTVYDQFLPIFEEFYAKEGQHVKFAPKHYKFKSTIDSEYVLLEDLKPLGFQNGDRLKGLDMPHTKCVLRKLAQFHAASVKYTEEHGGFLEIFNEGTFSEKSRSMMEPLFKTFNQNMIKATALYTNNEEYYSKVVNLSETYIDRMIKLNEVDPRAFNVLNHGDAWLNNIMFQHDESGDIKETFFVDFQVAKYGSPAIDLYYFLMSSAELNIKVEEFDFLIKFYHDNLVENMKLLNCTTKAPSLSEFHAALLDLGFLGFACFMGITTICLSDPNKPLTMENFLDDSPEQTDQQLFLYTNPLFKAQAEVVLPWLNRRGLLDL